jgi:glycosyltransferase involved in cell wall biosynthesis
MTGGLQEQVTDGENWFGLGIEPSSKAIIGSQDIPWIYEDRINEKEFADVLEKFYNLTKETRDQLGKAGREHVMKNYNFEKYQSEWVKIIDQVCEENGSWENRKNYRSWRIEQL